MNPLKKVHIIDDEPQVNTLEKITNGVKDKLLLELKQIEVLDTDFVDEQARLVPDKVYQAISDVFKKAHYDLILVDYSYGQTNFDGLDVIRFIRKSHPKDDLILYTANQKEVIGRIVGKDLQNQSTEKIISGINDLMNFRVAKIVPRPSMDVEVIAYLKEDTTFSPYGFITNMLRENSDKVFSSCFPKLAGKTYGEIADLLDSGNNGTSNEWLSAILEQLIVYLSEVNE